MINITLVTTVILGLFYFVKAITKNQKDLPNPPTYTPYSNLYNGNDLNFNSTKAKEILNDTKHKIEYEEKIDDK